MPAGAVGQLPSDLVFTLFTRLSLGQLQAVAELDVERRVVSTDLLTRLLRSRYQASDATIEKEWRQGLLTLPYQAGVLPPIDLFSKLAFVYGDLGYAQHLHFPTARVLLRALQVGSPALVKYYLDRLDPKTDESNAIRRYLVLERPPVFTALLEAFAPHPKPQFDEATYYFERQRFLESLALPERVMSLLINMATTLGVIPRQLFHDLGYLRGAVRAQARAPGTAIALDILDTLANQVPSFSAYSLQRLPYFALLAASVGNRAVIRAIGATRKLPKALISTVVYDPTVLIESFSDLGNVRITLTITNNLRYLPAEKSLLESTVFMIAQRLPRHIIFGQSAKIAPALLLEVGDLDSAVRLVPQLITESLPLNAHLRLTPYSYPCAQDLQHYLPDFVTIPANWPADYAARERKYQQLLTQYSF